MSLNKPANNKKWLLWGGLGVLALGAGLFWWGTRVETRRYRLETIKLRTNSLVPAGKAGLDLGPADKNGMITRRLRILHLSDLHLCGDDDHKVDFIRGITDDDYDMVVLSGDVFEYLDGLKYGPRLLTRRPRLGAYAVMGNHDYYDYSIFNKTFGRILRSKRHPRERNDITPHRIALEAGGWTVLVNETVDLSLGAEDNIFVVGIDYPGISDDDLQALMSKAPEGALKLSVFHLPYQLKQMVRAGIHLGFGGHTHGGQVRLPGVGALITDSELPRHEASGLVRRGESNFHISRGLGADPRSNIRLFCPQAATVVELEHTYMLATAPTAVQQSTI